MERSIYSFTLQATGYNICACVILRWRKTYLWINFDTNFEKYIHCLKQILQFEFFFIF